MDKESSTLVKEQEKKSVSASGNVVNIVAIFFMLWYTFKVTENKLRKEMT